MLRSHVDSANHRVIVGWAVDTDRPDQRILLQIMVNGAAHGTVVADQQRDGLRDHGLGDGSHGFTYVFDPPLSPLRRYDIVVRLGDRTAELPKGRFCLEPVVSTDLALRPLLVSATGRSGTTLLMRRLNNSRDVVIAGQYPFEMKLLTYYAHALEVLITPCSASRPTQLDQLLQDRSQLGLNPFHHHQMEGVYPNPALLYEFFGRRSAARLSRTLREIIEDFYRDMRIYGHRPQARFFAEKCDVFSCARNFARLAFDGSKELLLVRDPRDVHCSRRDFWSNTAERRIQNLRTVQAVALQIHEQDQPNLLLVRYEDLVQLPQETMAGIAEYLGLGRAIPLDASGEAEMFAVHGTSADPGASVGRWRQELSGEECKLLTETFRPFLDAFGYE